MNQLDAPRDIPLGPAASSTVVSPEHPAATMLRRFDDWRQGDNDQANRARFRSLFRPHHAAFAINLVLVRVFGAGFVLGIMVVS